MRKDHIHTKEIYLKLIMNNRPFPDIVKWEPTILVCVIHVYLI